MPPRSWGQHLKSRAHATSLAIVISDDGTTDLVPRLMPQIPHSALTNALALLHDIVTGKGDPKYGHQVRAWLNVHRFYLNAEECTRANADFAALKQITLQRIGMWVETDPFVPDPEMNGTYYLPEP